MKKRIISIFIAMLLLVAALGCETITVNSERDMAQIVAKIDDVEITKGEVYKIVASQLVTSGINIYDGNLDSYYRSYVDSYLQQILDVLVDREVMAKICDRDMPLTEEETKKVDEQLEEFIESIKSLLGYDPEKPEEYKGDIEKDVQDYFEKMGVTLEDYREDELKSAKYNKVMEAFKKTISATEEQVQQRYYDDVEAQISASLKADEYVSYKQLVDPDASSQASMTGSYVLVKPKSFLLVKHILLKYEEDDSEAISEILDSIDDAEDKLDKLNDEYEDIQDALEKAEKENNKDEINKQKSLSTAKQQEINTKEEEIDALKDDLEAAMKNAADKLNDKTNEIKAKIQAGVDFDELIKEYGEDPGMKTGANSVYGYLIAPETESYKPTDTWDEYFIEGVKTLNNTGDISDAVSSKHGVHIIKLAAGSAQYQVPFEQAKSYVKSVADKEKKDTAWNERLDNAREELNVEVYKEKVKWSR